ncbi:hypothetical protein [Tropicimonas sp.]|uniref:hypothetical protein n=1 Tax=Tropicimonas sp. TaxID=2067044 RepID=UPI003A839A8E
MAENGRFAEGMRTFLPYGLTVLGAAVGVLYVTYGTRMGNPLIGIVLGAMAGRFAAALIVRLAERRRM